MSRRGTRRGLSRLVFMSVDPGLPRRMSRVLHHIDDLFKLQSNANDTLS
jgi:hypothetical protein